MENATKALLIAGAIIIILAVLSLLVVFWDDVAIYFTATHEEKMLQQLIEFNNKFANYDGKEIRGNELVSIMNRIVDYNNFQSDMEGYEPIKITIKLKGKNEEFLYGGEAGGERIIKASGNITNKTGDTNVVDDTDITEIATTSGRLVNFYSLGIPNLTDTKLQKMSANISYIVGYEELRDSLNLTSASPDYKEERLNEYISNRNKTLTKILGTNITDTSDDSQFINNVKSATYQYYQYTMFKRAMFKCEKVLYNQTNGRINEMVFEVITETVTNTDGTVTETVKFD